MKHKLTYALFLLLLPLNLLAQKASNVQVLQSGQNIVITYSLNQQADVSLRVTANNGKTRIPATHLSGDIGKRVTAGDNKRIIWDVLAETDGDFKQQGVVFEVVARPVWKTFILADGGYSFKPQQWSAGIMLGMVKQAGWYVHARSNFMFTKPYSNDVITETNRDEYFVNGNKRTTEWLVDAGLLVRLGCPLYLYLGAGYGERKVYWQLINETSDEQQYLLYQPNSTTGVSAEAGLMFSIKGFTMELGVNTINFKYMELQAGIGWMF